VAARCSIIRKRYVVEFNACRHLFKRLPMGHIAALVSVEVDGMEQDINNYRLRQECISLPYYHEIFKVTYDAGFEDAAQVPVAFKMAILACAADLFIHRASVGGSGSSTSGVPTAHKMVQYYGNFLKNHCL